MCMDVRGPTHEGGMRTNIDIDDDVMAEALALTGLPSKKAVVDEALRTLIGLRRQGRAFENLRGLGWDGDLDAMREGWSFDDAR